MAILKLLHVLFVFIWVGTLLTLTRFVAYLASEPEEVKRPMMRLCRRLYFLVDLPAMIFAAFIGVLTLCLKEMNWKAPWLHMKLTFAFLLIVCDLYTGYSLFKQAKTLKMGRGRRYQIIHGIAGVLLIGILSAIYIVKSRSH